MLWYKRIKPNNRIYVAERRSGKTLTSKTEPSGENIEETRGVQKIQSNIVRLTSMIKDSTVGLQRTESIKKINKIKYFYAHLNSSIETEL